MISRERMEKAQAFREQTVDEAAELKVHARQLEKKAKRIHKAVFLRTDGKSVAEREAKAENHEEVIAGWDEYFQALLESEKMEGRREVAKDLCDLWRSMNANERAGFAT